MLLLDEDARHMGICAAPQSATALETGLRLGVCPRWEVSRRGNCHDNAVAESFFSSLKRERIRRRTYKTREEARQDVFDYIEMFYNPVRKHVRNGMLSPVEFERQQILKAEGV